MQVGSRSTLLRYGGAILAITIATVLRFSLDSVLEGSGLALFFIAVVIASWYGGIGPSILAFVLSLVSCILFFGRPENEPPDHPVRVLIGLGTFFFVGLATALLSEAVRKARQRAEQSYRDADRRKDEFLALLAHELRNPLAPIGNALQILKLAEDDQELRDGARVMMERQFQHLVRLVDDLLDVSRIARGKIELRPERTTLGAVLERAVEAARPLIDARHHTLSFDLPEHPLEIYVDPVRLAQVITNLLTNAAKYTDEGGKIVVAARGEDAELVLSVRDTGIGIPAEKLPRVFDMFMQVDQEATRAQGGLGIGLTLVRSMVQMHGGDVEVRSAGPGKGSEFIVRLPVGQPPRDKQEIPQLPQTANGRKSILVVDDNVDSANTLAALLKAKRHDVHVVYDGHAALQTVEQARPEVVILDLGLPGMDGCQVAERLRAREGGNSLLLLALTGWGSPEDRRRTQAAGFDYHFVKPANLHEIGHAIARGRREVPLEAKA